MIVRTIEVPPGTRLGNYAIEHWIGGGSMGAVYAAKHVRTDSPVAIKVLHDVLSIDADFKRRFSREAQAVARIDHPNTVRVLEVCADKELPYFVMERLEGEDLRSLLVREGALSSRRALALLLPVVRAIKHAHTRGVIHRDLKPENVFLAVCKDGSLSPKVLDFGVSKLLDETSVTSETMLLGTPRYMAPEQLEGAAQASPASDQYALGVMLYEALVGEAPFPQRSLYSLLMAISKHEFARPSERVADLDPRVEAIVMRAMAKAPSERFPSLGALARELELVPGTTSNLSRFRLRRGAARAPTLLSSTIASASEVDAGAHTRKSAAI